MKVTIDIDKLLQGGKITQAQYEQFRQLGQASTASLAFNLLVGFGVVAVAAGIAALTKSVAVTAILGLLLLLAGLFVKQKNGREWLVLANMLLITGALLFGGALFANGGGNRNQTFLLVAAVYAVTAWLAGSGLLAALAVIVLGGLVGTGTAYGHAAYFFWARKPLLTIILFSLIALAAWWLSRRLAAEKSRLLVIAARTAVFMAMLGFWIGSLWGDRTFTTLNRQTYAYEGLVISPVMLSIAWALALAAAVVWGWQNNRRWLVNTAAVFAAIHFYTQFFEHLRFKPVTILIGGLLALGFALGLVRLNRVMEKRFAGHDNGT